MTRGVVGANERGIASYKGGLLCVLLTVYPAESWAPRIRAHESLKPYAV